MRTLKGTATVVIALLASFASADEAANLTKAMQTVMDQYCKAIVKKDFKTADKIILANFAPDCKFTSQGKTIDLKTWMKMNNQQIQSMKNITKLSMKLTGVKIKGNKATGLEHFALVASVPTGNANKKFSVVDVTASNTTTMEKRGGKWLCTQVVSKPGRILIDGKPVDLGNAGTKK